MGKTGMDLYNKIFMKYILTFLMLIGIVYAQEPTYTPMKGNYKFKGIKVDSLFLIPAFSDTAAANTTNLDQIAGAMIRTGNDFWMRNASTTAWLQNVNIGDGANPSSLNLQNVTTNGNSTTDGIMIYNTNNNANFNYTTNSSGKNLTLYAANSSGNILFGAYDSLNSHEIFTWTIKEENDLSEFDFAGRCNMYNVGLQQIGIFTNGGATRKFIYDTTWNSNLNLAGDSICYIRNKRLLSTILRYDTISLVPIYEDRPKTTYYLPATAGSDYKDTLATLRDTRLSNPIARRNLNLSSANDTIKAVGTYMISTADSTNTFFLPNAANYAGKTIYIINKDASKNQKIGSLGGSIYNASAATLTKIYTNKFAIFTSDGTDWFGYNTN